jgi:hypothetical protein
MVHEIYGFNQSCGSTVQPFTVTCWNPSALEVSPKVASTHDEEHKEAQPRQSWKVED